MPDSPVVERIAPEFEALLPRFFEISKGDAEEMRTALNNGDFETLNRLGHTTRGTGCGYGFKGMGEIARSIELAAKARDFDKGQEQIGRLFRYLESVQIEFGE
ncbi:Hpt domain-containing protein [Pseudodesulfovibrio sp. JC047]|uniref:Hpt domain-containing protein n=1 Tax=Pseudodesulfovibrio sp. JC047 TaxID=2683199 RepID=UPI0013D05CF8|nr:Hpt domain-containing protein [Pseudodesulfovibrio sp. JC047]NDV19018.1 Hpt domain-containing protein [Pseudodesulfovibrio sp. JC047]